MARQLNLFINYYHKMNITIIILNDYIQMLGGVLISSKIVSRGEFEDIFLYGDVGL